MDGVEKRRTLQAREPRTKTSTATAHTMLRARVRLPPATLMGAAQPTTRARAQLQPARMAEAPITRKDQGQRRCTARPVVARPTTLDTARWAPQLTGRPQ